MKPAQRIGGAKLKRDSPYENYNTKRTEVVETLFDELWAIFENPDDKKLAKQREQCTEVGAEYVVCETPRMEDFYTYKENISTGIDGELDIVVNLLQNTAYCCRTISKKNQYIDSAEMRQKLYENIRKELYCMLNAPEHHMVLIHQVYENSTSIQIVMDWCSRGDLEYMMLQPNRPQKELEILEWFHYICEIVFLMHKSGMVHGDLKPEKFLFQGKPNKDLTVRAKSLIGIADLGLVKMTYTDTKAPRKCRKEQDYFYVAPENYDDEKPCTKKSDIWALGVMLFEMKFGFPPFISQVSDNDNLYKLEMKNKTLEGFTPVVKSEKGPWLYNDPPCSPELQDLLSRMLATDPKNRWSLEQIFEHPWMLRLSTIEYQRHYLADAIVKFYGKPSFIQKIMTIMLNANTAVPQDLIQTYHQAYSKFVDGVMKYTADHIHDDILVIYPEKTEEEIEQILDWLQPQENKPLDVPKIIGFSMMLRNAKDIAANATPYFKEADFENNDYLNKDTFTGVLKKLFGKETNILEIKKIIDDFIEMTNKSKKRIDYPTFIKKISKVGSDGKKKKEGKK